MPRSTKKTIAIVAGTFSYNSWMSIFFSRFFSRFNAFCRNCGFVYKEKCDSERQCLSDVRQVSRISIHNVIFIFSRNLRSLRFRSNFAQPSVMGPSFTKQNISDRHHRMWPPEAKLGHVVKIAIPSISLKLCTTIDNGFLIYHAKYFRRASKDVTSRGKNRPGRQNRDPFDFAQTSHNDR